MEYKKTTCVAIAFVWLLCCVMCITLLQKRQKGIELEYEPSLEVSIDKSFTLQGQNVFTGHHVPVEVSVKKAVISSGAIALFQNYYDVKDVSFSGVKDIAIHMKNGKVYHLWNDCKDKSISYDEERGEAITYILFKEDVSLKKIKSLEIAGQEFEVNDGANS